MSFAARFEAMFVAGGGVAARLPGLGEVVKQFVEIKFGSPSERELQRLQINQSVCKVRKSARSFVCGVLAEVLVPPALPRMIPFLHCSIRCNRLEQQPGMRTMAALPVSGAFHIRCRAR